MTKIYKHIMITLLSLMLLMMIQVPASAKDKGSMGLCKLTAYCPCSICSDHYGRQTATQKRARSGHTVAVDPDVIGYGAVLKIGKHKYIAEDCGQHVQGDHIDIFVDTHEEVEEFGVKYRHVWIVGRS